MILVNYINTFINLQGNAVESKWSNRIDNINFITKYYNIFDDVTTYTDILPKCLKYCLDNFSVVRMRAAKKSSRIFLQVVTSKDHTIKFKSLKLLEAFAFSINQIYRQL